MNDGTEELVLASLLMMICVGVAFLLLTVFP